LTVTFSASRAQTRDLPRVWRLDRAVGHLRFLLAHEALGLFRGCGGKRDLQLAGRAKTLQLEFGEMGFTRA